MKKILLLVMYFICLGASSQTFTIDNINYEVVSSNPASVKIIASPSANGSIVIPASVNNSGIEYSVDSIAAAAFKSNLTITGASIPSSVKIIKEEAFLGTRIVDLVLPEGLEIIERLSFAGILLESVSIPSTVTTIGDFAFQTNRITSIDIPTGVTSLGFKAFANNPVATISIPESITTIGNNVFEVDPGVTALTQVTVGHNIPLNLFQQQNMFQNVDLSTVTLEIPVGTKSAYQTAIVWQDFGTIEEAFEVGDVFTIDNINYEVASSNPTSAKVIVSPSATGNIIIPATVSLKGANLPVDSIAAAAFKSNLTITGASIPSSVKIIKEEAFLGTRIVDLVLPEGLEIIERLSFAGILLESVSIPSTVTTIGDFAFQTNRITSIDIPTGVTSLGFKAFANNPVATISIPESITTIGNNVFEVDPGVTALTQVTVGHNIPLNLFQQQNMFQNVDLSTVTLEIPVGTKSAYQTAIVWQDFGTIEEAFEVGDVFTIDNINYEVASSNPTSAKVIVSPSATGNIVIPATVSLKGVNLPVDSIAAAAFKSNLTITGASIPSSVKIIKEEAFLGTRIVDLVLPEGLEIIERLSFAGILLESVSIPSTVTTIGDFAFQTNRITSIDIPTGVTSLGFKAFANNPVATISIPESITTIGNNVFEVDPGVTALTQVTVGHNIPLNLFQQQNMFQNVDLSTVTLKVPDGTKSSYQAAIVWQDFGIIDELDKTAPVITSITDRTLSENLGGIYFNIIANESATFSLGSSKDESLFILNSNDNIVINIAPDFENPQDADQNNVYELDVIATDDAGNQSTTAFSMTITDLDEIVPNITSAATTNFTENSVEIAYNAIADEVVTFTLGTSKDENLFTIANGSQISFTIAPDFKTPLDNNQDNNYELDVTATDNAENVTTKAITITVIKAVDKTAPVITSITDRTLSENLGGIYFNIIANESATFSLGSSKDENLFTLNSNDNIVINVTPDFEDPQDADENNIYELDVIATDEAGNQSTTPFTMTITDQDEIAPTITSPTTVNFIENSTEVAYAATVDEVATFTLSTTKDETLFTLTNDSEIRFITAPDFESPQDGDSDNEYIIDIIATDVAGNATTKTVTITVIDRDEIAPIITSSDETSLAENSTEVAYSAIADESVSYALGNLKDEALFTLTNESEVRFIATPDFENPLDSNSDNAYLIDVIATDVAGNATTKTVTITVIDIDEIAPIITSSDEASLAENSTEVAYSAIADESVSYALGNLKDEALFTLTNESEVRFIATPDFENPLDSNSDNAYLIDVIATDVAGNATTKTVTITVIDIDEIAPIITSSDEASLAENSTEVAYSAIADESVSYALGNLKDEALFILTNESEVRFIAAPDFENPLDSNSDNAYLIDVIATDVAGNATTKTVTIYVTDADEIAPIITSSDEASLAENSTEVAYSAIADESVSYALGNLKDEALFILTNESEVRFIAAPDFENPLDSNSDNAYLIDVIATDVAGNATTKTVTIYVTDADEIASIITSSDEASLAENSTEVAYSAIADESVSYALGNLKDEALFILTNESEVRFIAAPDFENPLDSDSDNAYLIDVIATDVAGNATTKTVTIYVTDADEIAPIITSSDEASLAENSTEVAYSAIADESVNYALGNLKDEALFILTNESEVRFIAAPDFENPLDSDSDNAYVIDVIATDVVGNATTKTVTIYVTDVDELTLNLEPSNIELIAYPNPVNELLKIKSNETVRLITLIDMSGVILRQSTVDELNTADIIEGNYILIIDTKEEIITKKVSIKH